MLGEQRRAADEGSTPITPANSAVSIRNAWCGAANGVHREQWRWAQTYRRTSQTLAAESRRVDARAFAGEDVFVMKT